MAEDHSSQLQTVTLVEFGAGPFRFAVEASQIASVQEVLAQPTLNAASLLGVVDAVEAPRVLVVKAGAESVLVSGPVELRDVSVDAIFPLPDLVIARMGIKGAKALWVDEGSAVVVVDLCGLLEQCAF